MTGNDLNRCLVACTAVAALVIMMMPAIAGADPDLDAARAYGVRQVPTQRANREPQPVALPDRIEAGVTATIVPPPALKPSSDARADLKAEAASVREAVQRINEVANAALADYDRAGFEARLNASLAGVKAWLDQAPAASPPPAEDFATH